MTEQTRRDFLKHTAAAGSAVVLAPLAMAQEAAPVSMVICRYPEGGPVEDNAGVDAMAKTMAEKAIEALGGMGRFVKKGDAVWIKPNMAWDRLPEQAANTNPVLMATLVKMCLDAGAKSVKVGDQTCNEAKKSYPRSGIEAAVIAAGGEIVYLDENRFKEYSLGGKKLDKWPLYPEIVESDIVINVPIVKHHSIAKATVCMKNYMGVIGGNRGAWHAEMGTCLADITRFMKPKLCVVDATRILTANGPTGGNLADVKRINALAAGTDIVALDAWAVELLGHKPEDIESVLAGSKEGLGEIDYKKLAPKEIQLS
ncbi:MAG: hypothetical protein QG656_309 [Candidatus Hydrogenedentes bacterium]|nr:hypothetical protein [Candidatus Hydrogenedentota bacterium]